MKPFESLNEARIKDGLDAIETNDSMMWVWLNEPLVRVEIERGAEGTWQNFKIDVPLTYAAMAVRNLTLDMTEDEEEAEASDQEEDWE